MGTLNRYAGVGIAICLALAAAGQPCEPGWMDGFPMSDLNGIVRCMTVFDDGPGPALFVAARTLTSAGGVPVMGIARWDGTAWSSPGEGLWLESPWPAQVQALAVCTVGDGPRLYAGTTGVLFLGQAKSRALVAWDGASWYAVPGDTSAQITAVCSHRAGTALLCVAGDYGVYPAHDYRVRCFDGVTWTSLGEGFQKLPTALASFDAGLGAVLYAGGDGFSTKGNLLRWTGAAWEAVTGGQPDGAVVALRSLDVGDGPALYVGGAFSAIQTPTGPLVAPGIASLGTAGWSLVAAPGELVGSAGPPIVRSLATYTTGGTPHLALGGDVAPAADPTKSGVVARVGGIWVTLGGGFVGPINAVEPFGGNLIAGGEIIRAGSSHVNHIARFDGTSWSSLDNGVTNCPSRLGSGAANSVVFFNGLTYASGQFWGFDDLDKHSIAVWDGASWSIGDGGGASRCYKLLVHDDGTGPAMYGIGDFRLGPGETVSPIARWNGTSWSKVGHIELVVNPPGIGLQLYILAEHDDGTGKKLYAAGVAGPPYPGPPFVASWNGTTWNEIGHLIPTPSGGGWPDPWALTSAPGLLYLTGGLNPPYGMVSPAAAAWNGTSWAYAPGQTYSGPQRATAAAVRDGRLYVTGRDSFPTDVRAAYLTPEGFAQFGPPLGSYMTTPRALGWFDDGIAERMYVAGSTCCVGRLPAHQSMLTYDGASWTPFVGGVLGEVLGIDVVDDGSGRVLWVSGNLVRAGGMPTNTIGRYRACDHHCHADYNHDGFLDPLDYNGFINAFEANDMAADFNGDGQLDPLDYNAFINAFEAGC